MFMQIYQGREASGPVAGLARINGRQPAGLFRNV